MLVAWHGEQSLKDATMARLREDRKLDRIVQGRHWSDGRGCHLGCLTRFRDDAHEAAERMFGIPLKVAYWLEAVFEGLPESKCEWWVIEGTNAIPVGADLSLAHHELAYWLLGPESPSAKGNGHKIVANAIADVRELHRRAAAGETGLDWSVAWSAAESAWSAAESARSAEGAAESAEGAAESARSAVWSERSAWSAAWSAWSAAESAVWSAWSAESAAAWPSIAKKSIEIFRAAPIVTSRCQEGEGLIREGQEP